MKKQLKRIKELKRCNTAQGGGIDNLAAIVEELRIVEIIDKTIAQDITKRH